MKKIPTRRWVPLILTAVTVAADQLTKWIVVQKIALGTIGWQIFGDFFRLVHVRNTAVAFSLGHSLPAALKGFLFLLLPLLILAAAVWYLLVNDELKGFQRWLLAGIIGGGIGNLIDRAFRPAGVVDFLDVKFYGLFGLERWPTFNVADSVIVVTGILLFVSFIFERKERSQLYGSSN